MYLAKVIKKLIFVLIFSLSSFLANAIDPVGTLTGSGTSLYNGGGSSNGISCSSDNDCPGSTSCVQNRCTGAQRNGTYYSICDSDNDCRIGLVCFEKTSTTKYCVAKQNQYTSCNSNDECNTGFVCLGGTADLQNDYSADGVGNVYTGYCKPTTALKQICLIYEIQVTYVAQISAAIAIVALGASFFFGKIQPQQIIIFAAGLALAIGSLQILYIVTGAQSMTCEYVKQLNFGYFLG